jgi:signal transduction histidine kinase
VTITIKADHKVSLYGSRLSFNRIIKNLIINSAEAYRLVSCDEKKIVLELKNSDKQVLLTINDTAGGISKLTAKHIFSPRFTTKNGEGSGMGLGIVKKKIQKDFNGNIFIDSKGRKTTFTILISKNGTNISHSVIHPKRDALPKNIATV